MKETEPTLLDQIKDDVAEQYGQISWKYAMQNNGSHGISALWEYVCERYYQAKAKASCEATLKRASDVAAIKQKLIACGQWCGHSACSPTCQQSATDYIIDKSSITDPSNIVIL